MPKKRKPAEPENLTNKILVQIRDGVDKLSERLDTTRAELVEAIGRTNDRVDALTARVDAMGARLTATEMRLGTQHAEILHALEKLQSTVADALSRDAAINDLDERVSALEQKAGVSQ